MITTGSPLYPDSATIFFASAMSRLPVKRSKPTLFAIGMVGANRPVGTMDSSCWSPTAESTKACWSRATMTAWRIFGLSNGGFR